MKNFFEVGKHIGLKTCRLCKIAFQTIIRLAFICFFKLRSKILNRTVGGLGMSRQMGPVVSTCRDNNCREAGDNLMKQLKEQIKENGILQQKLDDLTKIREDQDEMIEKQFGKDVERTGKGRWNNAGDMNQPMSLSTRFVEIYNKEWREVMRTLFGKENELKGIRFLSKIIKDCQSFCQTKANEQIMRFVHPYSHIEGQSVKEVILSDEEQHDLYKLRRKIGLYAPNKEALIKLFTTECKESEDYRSVTQGDGAEKTECLDSYISCCCELCWQFAISIPPVFLKFDVLGEHIAEIKDQYLEYPYTGQTEEGIINTVMDVVWPAVVMRDDEMDILLDKGSVIVFSSTAV